MQIGLGISPTIPMGVAIPPFNPASISGLQLWLDASDSSTLFRNSNGTTAATADGDPVGYWADKSGNGRAVTQTDGTKKPALKLAVKNNRNVIRLDGVNDFMQYLTNFTYQHIFVVNICRNGNSVPPVCASSVVDGGGYQNPALRKLNNSTWGANNADDWAPNVNIRINGAATNLLADNLWGLISANRGSQYTGGFVLSSIYLRFFSGDVAEILCYSSAINGNNLSQLESYLNSKWSIY